MDETTGSAARRPRVAAFVFLLPLFYFLSVGPAVVLHDQTTSSQVKNALETFYYPLEIVFMNVTPLQKPMELYLELWK